MLVVTSFDSPSNLLADSSYLLTRQIIKNSPPDFFTLWILPQLKLKFPRIYSVSEGTSFTEPDRCEIIQVPLNCGRHVSEMLISSELFDLINPHMGPRTDYDIIFTNNGCVAQRLVDWMCIVFPARFRPPVVVLDYSTPFLGKGSESVYIGDCEERARTHYTGYANADWTVFMTPYAQKKGIAQMRNLTSPSTSRSFSEKQSMIPMLFSKTLVKSATKNCKKRNRFSVYWGGRLTATKRPDVAAEVGDYFFCFGGDVEIVITTPRKVANTHKKLLVGTHKHSPVEVEMHSGLSQEDALRQMAQCHVSIFPQSLKFGPAAPLEQLCAGLIVLINRKDSDGILPKEYPWYWSSKLELNALFRRVARNYSKEYQEQEKWKQYVEDHFSLEARGQGFFSVLREIVERKDAVFKKSNSQLIKGRVEEGVTGETWSQAYKRILHDHALYKQVKSTFNPPIKNPFIWGAYQGFRIFTEGDHLRKDPIVKKEGQSIAEAKNLS